MTILVTHSVEEQKERQEITNILRNPSQGKTFKSELGEDFQECFIFTADDPDKLYGDNDLVFTNMTSNHVDKAPSQLRFCQTNPDIWISRKGSEHPVNQNIAIDDSFEVDADEYKPHDRKINKKMMQYAGNCQCMGGDRQTVQDGNQTTSYAAHGYNNAGGGSHRGNGYRRGYGGNDDGDDEDEEGRRNRMRSFNSHSSILADLSQMEDDDKQNDGQGQQGAEDESFEPSFHTVDAGDMHKLITPPKDRFERYGVRPEIFVDSQEEENQKEEPEPNTIFWEDIIQYNYKYNKMKGETLAKFLDNWKLITQKDDCRYPYSYKSGGKTVENPILLDKLRNLGKEIIKEIGKKILSGNFNLTTITFPIKAMVAKSTLEMIAYATVYYPLYLNQALKTKDPLKRFKYFIAATMSYMWCYCVWCKPLNPILGETLNGHYEDGSKVFIEQVSHHPPVSYLYYEGPRSMYKVYGPSELAVNASLNSLALKVKGFKEIVFKDTKQKIRYTPPSEEFDGTFFGTTTFEYTGNITYKDVENNIECVIKMGSMKKKPSDYFDAVINVNGKPVSKVMGTYLGWLEIDGQRYFDYRQCHPFNILYDKSPLGSDFQYRQDLITLQLGQYKQAQKEKEMLEHIQRTDRKLRNEYKEKHKK